MYDDGTRQRQSPEQPAVEMTLSTEQNLKRQTENSYRQPGPLSLNSKYTAFNLTLVGL